MKGSAALFVAVLGIFLLTVVAFAEQIVELDLDGVLGNGPDTIDVAVGAEVDVDVWLLGGNPLFSFDLVLCNPGGTVEYQGTEYHAPPAWTVYPPEFSQIDCVRILGVDWSYEPFGQPAHTATITYWTTTEDAFAVIEVDSENSEVIYADLSLAPIDSTVRAHIRIGPTATECPTWGSIKKLFR